MSRKNLTKSLHTVSAVTAVTLALRHTTPWELSEANVRKAVGRALEILGQAGPWPEDDETVAACIRAVFKACLK